MVKIIGTKQLESQNGKPFLCLKLQGGVEAVQSQETGKMYLTVRKCTIPCTFDAATAQSLIGQELPGSIHKVATSPYEYTNQETGEIIMLTHRYEYFPIEEDATSSEMLPEIVSEEAEEA